MEKLKDNAKKNLSRLRKIDHHEYLVKVAKHAGLHTDAAALQCSWELKD